MTVTVKTIVKTVKALAYLGFAFLLSASDYSLCGCDGCGSKDVVESVFIDDQVSGMVYESRDGAGRVRFRSYTKSNGAFFYENSNRVAFKIGDTVLGEVANMTDDRAQISPVDIVAGATSADNTKVTNILRLLQTLDSDNNPDTGITIPREVDDAAQGQQINLDLPETEFANDPVLQTVLTAAKGADYQLIEGALARAHFTATLIRRDLCANCATVNYNEATFFDSRVSGLPYTVLDVADNVVLQSETQGDGDFFYVENQKVVFNIGDTIVGTISNFPATVKTVTPLDLVPLADSPSQQQVANILRFLQSLDRDDNPDNGIDIPESAISAAAGLQVNFDVPTPDFSNDTALQAILTAVKGVNYNLVSAPQAVANFEVSQIKNGLCDPCDTTLGLAAFLDSPVSGLEYESRDSVTNDVTITSLTSSSTGNFIFRNNNIIRFKIGDTLLGETQALPTSTESITPVNLVPDASGPENRKVTNILRFLQSLDADDNVENGILIGELASAAAQGQQVEFDVPVEDFANDAALIVILTAVKGAGYTLVSAETALSNFNQ